MRGERYTPAQVFENKIMKRNPVTDGTRNVKKYQQHLKI